MKNARYPVLMSAALLLFALSAGAQAPLAQPLTDFDKLVSQLRSSNVVGEPIRVGETTVVPFAKISFGLGGGGAMMGYGGGMGAKTVPLGILIVDGDDVRAELFPEPEEKPSFLKEIFQAILERKIVFMGNAVNAPSAQSLQDMLPALKDTLGGITIMGNAINAPRASSAAAATAPSSASPAAMKELFEAKKYPEALAMADALVAKNPKDSELHVWKGRIMGGLARSGNMMDMMKYGPGAMQEFQKAVELDPKNPDALLGRGVSRLMAPQGFGGDIDGAIADFEATVAIKPSPEAYYYLGEAYMRKGLKDKAASAFKEALKLRPGYSEAAKALEALK
jgi:tetratricopeptide (TPR) repeat protein